ncbi:hypothetical protein RhiJN_18525 [Ceratobasidium sp. AG-Ba]|nr:hypothetical protein RhiJN_18525 [Ceratobasidium sp. AG-Ba]
MSELARLIGDWRGYDAVYSVAVSPDSDLIAVGGDQAISVCDVHTIERLGPIMVDGERIRSVAFSPDGRRLASGSTSGGNVRIWDMTMSQGIASYTGGLMGVNSVAFSHDGRIIISGDDDGNVRLWDVRIGNLSLGRPITGENPILSIAISASGRTVVAGDVKGTVMAYDLATSDMLFECTGHKAWVKSVAISPGGNRIASGSADRTIRMWDGITGASFGEPLKGHTDLVLSVAFSPDGRYIASGSADTTTRLWDIETGETISSLLGHSKSVNSVAFTPDGSRLISGSRDWTINIRDVGGLRERAESLRKETPMEPQAVEAKITNITTPQQIVSLLRYQGCVDLTSQLDLGTCTEYPISSGGFGDIYRCTLKDDTQVAIKTIRLYVGLSEQDYKVLKYAARELYTWSKCQHPNVQPLLGLVMFRGQIGMIARWESNGSLPFYLERNPDVDRCIISNQIAEGLSYLHGSGVVHGDLKGANVLISQDGIAQLADFGNATLQEYTLRFTKTSTKEVLSSRWAAPELFEGASCNLSTDVYALGMTILETITSDIPWTGMSDRAVMFSVMIHKSCPERPESYIPKNSDHGDKLWSLLQSCWSFDPETRPSAGEVTDIMSEIKQSGGDGDARWWNG